MALVSNGERLSELSEKAANSQDAATLQVLKTMDSIEAKTQQLQTSLQSLYTSTGVQNLFKGILDYGNNIITTFTKMPTVFNLPLVAITKLGTQFFTLANVVTTVFGLIKSRLTMQSKILQGQMTNDAKTGATSRAMISEQEAASIFEVLTQEGANFEQLQKRMDEIQAQHSNNRIQIARNEAKGISKVQTKGGLIASAAGSALSLLSSTMGENTQAQRNAKGLTDLAGSVLSGVGTGLMIGGPAGAAVGALTVLPGLITSISTMIETAAEKQERLKKAVEETNNAYLQKKDTAKTLEEQIEKLEELEKTQNDSAEAREKFIEASNQIAQTNPELISGYDLEGNALIDLTSSYYALKQAREAANEAAKETAKASVAQADNNLKEAEENRQKALDSYAERLKGGYKNSKIDEIIETLKSQDYNFGDEKWFRQNLEAINPSSNLATIIDSFPLEDYEAMNDILQEYYGKTMDQLIEELINSSKEEAAPIRISEIKTGLDGDQKRLFRSIEDDLLDGNTEKAINLINEKREEINKIREKLESDGDKTNDWAIEYLNSMLEINGEVTGVMADAAKAAKVRESVVRSQLSSLSSSMLKTQENDIGNEYLKEIENVNNFVTQYLTEKFSKSETDFDTYVEKKLSNDLQDAQDVLSGIWAQLGSSFKKENFNELIKKSKQYSPLQMTNELQKLLPDLDNQNLSILLRSLYGDNIASAYNNYKQAVKQRLENDSGELAKTLDTFSRFGMGETDFSAILDKYDQLQEMVAGGAITDNYAASLLQQYKNLLDASKKIKDSTQREQVQTALQELDLTSLESVNTFIETVTEIGFLVGEEGEKTAKALREAVPVNLNTEVNTYVEKISSEMEDFESALSKATSGMKYKDAAAIAAKMDVSVDDFRQVGDKFFIDDLDALEKAYFDTSNDLVEGLHGKIEKLSEGLNDLGKIFLNDNVLKLDSFSAQDYFSSDTFKNVLDSTLQEAGVNVNLESLELESTYSQWIKNYEEIGLSFVDYLIQQLTSSLEEAEKVQKVINTQKAEGYLAQGNFTKFLDNLDLNKEQRSRAQGAFNEGNLDKVFEIIPQYADKITETFKKINQDIYNRMTSETSSDNWIKYDDSNKDLFNELARKGLIGSDRRKDQDGNFWYKLEEITNANIKDYYDTITNDATLTSSEKAAARAKATNKVFNESIDKYLQDAFKNSDKISQEVYENLKQAVIDNGNSIEKFENYFTQEAGSNELQLTDISGLIALLQQFGITIQQATIDAGNEAVEKTIDSFLKEVSNATSLITKGTTSQTDEQSFVEKYNELMKEIGDSSRITSDEAFTYDSELKVDTLNNDVFKKYIEATKIKLKNLRWSEERINQYINDLTNKALAEAVDIDAFLKAENREVGSQAYNKLADQMRDYYSTIYDSEEEVNKRVQEEIEAISKDGRDAAAWIQVWAQRRGEKASSSDIETAYRAEISQLENAFDQLSYGVGSIVSGEATKILSSVEGYKLRSIGGGSAVIESIGDVTDAYLTYYEELKTNDAATVAALNEAYAKVLETRDDSDVISALGDAASMTYTRLGEILATKGLKLEEQILDGIVESIGGGKVRITNFDRFATEIMQWTDIDKNSEEYISAFKTYNDSLISMNRKAEKNIVEEVQKLETAQAGDQINLAQLVSGLGVEVTEALAASLKDNGALLENGILTLEQNANIPAIIQNLSKTAAENGLLLQDSMAQLADTLNSVLKNYASLINTGIEGNLTNSQAQQIQTQAQSLGYVGKLDFTQTVNGLKLSEESARGLYEHLRSIDSLKADLVFDKLYKSITDSHQGLKTMSGSLAAIKKIQEEIEENEKKINKLRAEKNDAKADQIEKENNKLKEQLSIYEQINTKQRNDASSYDFMNQDLPDTFKGAENYWNSVGSAFKAMNEAGETGYMSIKDFYNIVNEMSNLAVMSGKDLQFMGRTLKKDGTGAAELIEQGMGALSNVDGKGVAISLKKLGGSFANGAQDMQSGFQEGIKAMAESQIKVLDAQIAMLETLVAMEQIGDIDVNGNGILDISDIFQTDENGNYIKKDGATQYTKEYQDAADKIIKAADANEDLEAGLNAFKINGISAKEMLEDAADGAKDVEISEEVYFAALEGIVKAAQDGDFNPEDMSHFWEDIAEYIPDGYEFDMGNVSVIVHGGATTTIDWEDPDIQALLKEYGGDTEDARDKIKQAVKDYDANNKELNTLELKSALVAKGIIEINEKNGKIIFNGKEYDSDSFLTEDLVKAIIEDKIPNAKNVEVKNENGEFSGTYQLGDRKITISYNEGKVLYHSDVLNRDFNSQEELLRAEYSKYVETNSKNSNFELPTYEQWLYQKYGITTNIETTFKDSKGNEIKDPANNTDFKRAAQDFVSKSESAIDAYLNDPNNFSPNGDGTYTLTLINGDKITFAAENEEEAKTKAREEAAKFADPLVDSVAAGIKAAFTDDDNTIGKAIGEGIVAALNNPENFKDKNFSIPTTNATLDEVIIDDVVNAKFDNNILEKGLKKLTGQDVSDLTIPEATATVETLTIDKATTTNFAIAKEGQSNVTIDNLTAAVNKLTLTDILETTDVTSVAQQIVDGLQDYFKDNPVSVTVEPTTPNAPESKGQTPTSTSGTPQAISPVVDLSGITALQNAMATLSSAGTAAAAELGQMNANLINSTVKATNFEEALSNISDNGKTKANDFSMALDGIKQNGVNYTNSFKEAINDIKYSGASNASAFRYAVNGTYENGARHAERFRDALNSIGSQTLKVEVSVNTTGNGAGQTNVKGAGTYSWSWAKGNALAGGKTLMGELGPELVVSHGRYFLVGQNGPEMVNLDEDAIVFNHLQTKKLIENGKISSHGTPVTNERKATSMATGNFDGPAMASASEVLATLKQLREMWKSLLNATAKDIGMMAGKAGKTKKSSTGTDKTADETKKTEKYTAGIESNVERWYNWLQAIEATQYRINKLTKEYSILEKEGVSAQEKLENLQEQYKLRQENKDTRERLAKEQTEYRNELIDEANVGLMSAFYQADKETGQVYLANDDAFQKYLQEQLSRGYAAGELSTVLAKKGSIKQQTEITRELSKREREAKAEEEVRNSYGRQSKVPSYLKQFYKNGSLIEGKEEEAKKAAAEEYKKSKYNKTVKTTREIRTGFDFMDELQAQDSAGNLIHDAEDQLALIKQMGLFTEDLMVGIDTETEGWESQVVQRFYDKVEEDKEGIESITNSIRDQELAALDEAAAMEEINEKIRSIMKVSVGVTDGLEKWYNETIKIKEAQQEINKLVKEMELLQKDQVINGEEIYESYKKQEKSLKNQLSINDDLLAKRRKEAEELKEKYSDLPIVIDENGAALFSEQKIGTVNGYGSVNTSYSKVKTNAQGYEVDVNGNYRDKEGNLRDSEGNKIEGNFGELATETVTGHKAYNFANKSIQELIEDLQYQDAFGNTAFKAEEQYQILTAAGFEKYMRFDEKGNEVYDNFGALTQDQMQQAVKAGIARLQNAVKEVNDNNDQIVNLEEENLTLQSNLLDIQNALIDNQIEVEKMVKDAVVQEHQDAIDAKKELKDALDDAASRTVDGLRESLDSEKAMYDKAENQEQLATLQRQLEVAQRSGASLSKIQGLQDQVASAQKDMYFTEREELIDNIENSMQREIEALDTQISIMEATLEYQEKYGLLWEEVNKILAGTPASIIDYINTNTPGRTSMSETERADTLVGIGDKVGEFKAYIEDREKEKTEAEKERDELQVRIEQIQKDQEEASGSGATKETRADKKEVEEEVFNGEDAEITFEDGLLLEMDDVIDPNAEIKLTLSPQLVQSGGLVWDEAWDTNKNKKYNPNKGIYGIKDVIDKAKKIAKNDPSISDNDVIKALQARYIRQFANEYDSPEDIAKQWNGWKDSTLKNVLRAELKKIGKVPRFLNGGDIDFTGLAHVDGTKNEPEHIFNFQQMEALRAHLLNGVDVTRQAISGLSDTLNQMPNISTYNSINNTTDSGISIGTLEFHMEVSEIANDYDARRAGEQAMNEIVRIARKSGTRSLSRR